MAMILAVDDETPILELIKNGVKKVYVVCAAIGAGLETVLHEQGDS